MTHDDMERAIEFILQQQAKFAEDLRQHRETFTADVQKMKEFSFELAKGYVRTQNTLDELGTAQRKTEAKLAELAQAQRELTEAQKVTEQRLSAFIGALERRFGGNGKGRKSG